MRFDFHDGWVAKIAGLFEVAEIIAKHFDVASVGKITHLL